MTQGCKRLTRTLAGGRRRGRSTLAALTLAAVIALALAATGFAANAKTTLLSVSSSGKPANAASGNPALSADGRFVAFVSFATNLDPSGVAGIFVRDRKTGTTRVGRASLLRASLLRIRPAHPALDLRQPVASSPTPSPTPMATATSTSSDMIRQARRVW